MDNTYLEILAEQMAEFKEEVDLFNRVTSRDNGMSLPKYNYSDFLKWIELQKIDAIDESLQDIVGFLSFNNDSSEQTR